MKKIFQFTDREKNNFFPNPGLIWGFLSMLAWSGIQIWRAHQGGGFSLGAYGKGLSLLLAAAWIYRLSSGKGFSCLGLFPLLWLAVSSFQRDLCASVDFYPWLWLFLFLASEILILKVSDGKNLLLLWAPLWGALTWLFSFSLLLPLAFVTASRARFKRAEWIRWGSLGAGLIGMVLFRGWRSFHWDWVGLYDLLIPGRFIAFLLLGWLGLVAFSPKGPFRHLVFPVFFLCLGFLFWQKVPPVFPETELLKWILVFFAGFGWESFRKDLMDPTWHGRAVWAALGLAFFGGMF